MNLTNIPLTKDISHNQDSRVVPHQVAMENPPNLVPWFFPLLHCFSAGQPDTLQMLTLQFTSLSSHGLGRRCWRFLERNCDRFIGSCKKCRLLLGITYTLYIYMIRIICMYTQYISAIYGEQNTAYHLTSLCQVYSEPNSVATCRLCFANMKKPHSKKHNIS